MTGQSWGDETLREIQASDAKTHLSSLLDDVERGETLVITRHGKPIARIVPELEGRREKVALALVELDDLRKSMRHLTLDDLLSARHEGHRY